jgi:hypothetical protein
LYSYRQAVGRVDRVGQRKETRIFFPVYAGTTQVGQATANNGPVFITTTVLAAGPEFKVLATNELDSGYTLSSPAISGSQLFLRTAEHLYCIGQ